MANPAPPPRSAPARKRGAAALGALVPDAVAPVLRERGFASTAVLTVSRSAAQAPASAAPTGPEGDAPAGPDTVDGGPDGAGAVVTRPSRSDASPAEEPPTPSRTRTTSSTMMPRVTRTPSRPNTARMPRPENRGLP